MTTITTINNWNKDKQIQKILLKTIDTLNEGNINIKNINNDLALFVLDSSYNPIFIATLWKLYKYLHETSKYSNNLFWITCGNTAGYFKYNGHIPWDDDIDIGFKITNNYDDYIAFLIECINCGLIVNLHLKKKDDDKINWYENDTVVNLILDSRQTPTWNHIRENEFRKLIKTNPSKFHFASVTIHEYYWKKIANNFELDNMYFWGGKSIVTPWIDVIPYFNQNNVLVPGINDLRKKSPNLSTTLEHYDFLTVPGKFPIDLLQGLLIQYNENRSYVNFLHWDTIFSHVKQNKIVMQYNSNPELHKFIRTFITKYNDTLLCYMDQINYNDLMK